MGLVVAATVGQLQRRLLSHWGLELVVTSAECECHVDLKRYFWSRSALPASIDRLNDRRFTVSLQASSNGTGESMSSVASPVRIRFLLSGIRKRPCKLIGGDVFTD